MESIKEIYRIGFGPSSSHTMGPRKAAQIYRQRHSNNNKFKVTLYGSLALTGKGHLTDEAILQEFEGKEVEIIWQPNIFLPQHPNALKFETIDSENTDEWTVFSIGGGKIIDETMKTEEQKSVYPHKNLKEILKWCYKNGKQLWQYVYDIEGEQIKDYLYEVWLVMVNSINRGLKTEGTLPGSLKLARKASSYYTRLQDFELEKRKNALVYAYALAVSEENAAGGKIVTAPTCGSAGILPAVLYWANQFNGNYDKQIVNALATAGLIGNIVKHNASISGAQVGCQGEVGTACSMASAAMTQLRGGSIFQIEYAAEMGLEHHLGLTCDPVDGLVQIPCIERNALAAARALDHATYAILSDGRHMIDFDAVVEAMNHTGKDIPPLYRETSQGGLAIFHGLDI